MKIKKGDKVRILSGKDKGKTGPVTRVLSKSGKVIVEGINMTTKHQRPRKEGDKGTKIQFPAPLVISNVIVICPKCGKETRINFIKQENNKKIRQCKKCKATF
ncbi:50S ribosomal protein L24 [Patescibacteria group bacterium]